MTPRSARTVRRALAAAALALSACGTDSSLHGPASAAGGDPGASPPRGLAPALAPPAAPRVAVAQFSCIGMLAPPQVRQRVTGGLTAAGEPVDVAFLKASNSIVKASGAEPVLDPAYDAGSWLATYGYQAWRVATTDVGTWMLLFPPGPYPIRFDAMAVTDYAAGGSYQDQLTCAIL